MTEEMVKKNTLVWRCNQQLPHIHIHWSNGAKTGTSVVKTQTGPRTGWIRGCTVKTMRKLLSDAGHYSQSQFNKITSLWFPSLHRKMVKKSARSDFSVPVSASKSARWAQSTGKTGWFRRSKSSQHPRCRDLHRCKAQWFISWVESRVVNQSGLTEQPLSWTVCESACELWISSDSGKTLLTFNRFHLWPVITQIQDVRIVVLTRRYASFWISLQSCLD